MSGFDHPEVNADYETSRILKDTEAFLKQHPPSSAAIAAHKQQQLRQKLPRMGGVAQGSRARKSSRSRRRFLAGLKLWQVGMVVFLAAGIALAGWAVYTEFSSSDDYDDYDLGEW